MWYKNRGLFQYPILYITTISCKGFMGFYEDIWALFQYKDSLSRYGYFHVKDNTVERPSYLWHGDPYAVRRHLYIERASWALGHFRYSIRIIKVRWSWNHHIFMIEIPMLVRLQIWGFPLQIRSWPSRWLSARLQYLQCVSKGDTSLTLSHRSLQLEFLCWIFILRYTLAILGIDMGSRRLLQIIVLVNWHDGMVRL